MAKKQSYIVKFGWLNLTNFRATTQVDTNRCKLIRDDGQQERVSMKSYNDKTRFLSSGNSNLLSIYFFFIFLKKNIKKCVFLYSFEENRGKIFTTVLYILNKIGQISISHTCVYVDIFQRLIFSFLWKF